MLAAHLGKRQITVNAIAELNPRGVPTFVEAADYPNIGVRVGFVKDNNGNVIEFSGSMNSARLVTQLKNKVVQY